MSANRQAYLLDMYYRALKRDSQARPPDGLDKEIAAIAQSLTCHVRLPEPSPGEMERLKARIFTGESTASTAVACRCPILRRSGFQCEACPRNNNYFTQIGQQQDHELRFEDGSALNENIQTEPSGNWPELEAACALPGDGGTVAMRRELPRVVSPTGLLPADLD
ncbi:MAG TPA: hypothetical protein VF826_20630 [Chloroflexia bacterium]|jgi:hypothetical protein